MSLCLSFILQPPIPWFFFKFRSWAAMYSKMDEHKAQASQSYSMFQTNYLENNDSFAPKCIAQSPEILVDQRAKRTNKVVPSTDRMHLGAWLFSLPSWCLQCRSDIVVWEERGYIALPEEKLLMLLHSFHTSKQTNKYCNLFVAHPRGQQLRMRTKQIDNQVSLAMICLQIK